MSFLNICVICSLLLAFSAVNADGAEEEVPLKIIWHVVTQGPFGCSMESKLGKYINVTQYGMLENHPTEIWPETDGYRGDKIAILYKNMGHWPFMKEEDDGSHHPKNGGLPQSGDITKHLEKLEVHINEEIPDRDFSGLGVLDFEEWFAIWDMNFEKGSKKIYRTESIKLANGDEAAAKEEFDKYAKIFFEETLKKAKQMRPKAKWGYYIYPKCNYKVDLEKCSPNMDGFKTQLDWLVRDSDVLFPSVYYYTKTDKNMRPGMAMGQMDLVRDWLDYVGEPYKPVYLYTKTVLEGDVMPPPYYSNRDIIASLGTAADMGVGGIIIWGNKERSTDKEQCIREMNHVKKLGPYVQRLLNFFTNCSRDVCSNHGRCAKNEVEFNWSKIGTNLNTDHEYNREDAENLYHCLCYEGWTGPNCAAKK